MAQFSANWTGMKQRAARIKFAKYKLSYYNFLISIAANDLPFSSGINRQIRNALKNSRQKLSASTNKIGRISDSINEAADLYKNTEKSLSGGYLFILAPPKGINSRLFHLVGPGSNSSDFSKPKWIDISLLSGEASVGTTVMGLSATALAKGSISNFKTDYGLTLEQKFDDSGNLSSLGVEAKAGASYSVASGELEGSLGMLKGNIKGSVGNAAVEGKIGASLVDDGKFSPSIYAKANAGASVLKGSASYSVGNDENNVFTKAEGEVLGAKANAEGSVGVITTTDSDGTTHKSFGVKGVAGAEAYIAQGSVSRGYTFMGIKVTGSVSGKAGGAGVSAGGSITTGGVSGEIGAGLGLGVGIKVDVDWSGFNPGKVLEKYKFWYKKGMTLFGN